MIACSHRRVAVASELSRTCDRWTDLVGGTEYRQTFYPRRYCEEPPMARSAREPISVPVNYPTSSIFMDESGSKATASQTFVVAAIKLREPGKLARAVAEVRERTGFDGELKFSEINRNSVPVYQELISALEASDAVLAACVVKGDVYNPFKGQGEAWRAHAEVISQLLVGCINRRELVGVLLDGISTPRGTSLEDTVRNDVNRRLRATSVVSAVCLDSRTNDLLQLADLVAGAIFHERRRLAGGDAKATTHKGKVANRLAAAFGRPNLIDGRDERLNIATYRGQAPRSGSSRGRLLKVVGPPPQTG